MYNNLIKQMKQYTLMGHSRFSTVLLISSLLLAFSAQALEVTATVDKNPVMMDESFTLSIVADDDLTADGFDPSPLMQDFVVGRTSVSRQTQMINFDTTRTTRWSTVLIPRKQGRFTIPALTVAGVTTQPINVMVIPVSSSNQSVSRDLFVATSVDANQVYLQQQIRYTTQLHLAVDLQRGSLATPVVADADVRQIGKDREFSQIENGRRYRVIERTFAIIPQKSGRFTINGPLFEGEVVDNSNQSFGFFKRTKTINRVGPNIDIEVLPVPSSFSQHWLPSDFVQLNEEWQSASGEYKVGEPITRTLTLTAVGLVEEQLPEINSQYPDSAKTYPDQANTVTVERDDNLIAQRTEVIAIIPSQAGELVIPEVKVPWFNIVTKQTEYATLPAKTLTIVAGEPSNAVNYPVNVPASVTPVAAEPAATSQPIIIEQTASWTHIHSALLALWLLTLGAWWWHVSRLKSAKVSPRKKSTSAPQTDINSVLKSNSPTIILPVLTQWLAEYCNNPQQSLASSQQQLADNELNAAISEMLGSVYSQQSSSWNSQQLALSIKKLIANRQQKPNNGSALKPLHP
ncbi:BatD family protein [Alteromonadaceae bacterium BrNp21-10]|nr:BatD family protein [Alteromonadaceae bacterium BrNp21-10]